MADWFIACMIDSLNGRLVEIVELDFYMVNQGVAAQHERPLVLVNIVCKLKMHPHPPLNDVVCVVSFKRALHLSRYGFIRFKGRYV